MFVLAADDMKRPIVRGLKWFTDGVVAYEYMRAFGDVSTDVRLTAAWLPGW